MERALSIAQATHTADQPIVSSITLLFGDLEFNAGHLDAARERMLEAVHFAESGAGDSDAAAETLIQVAEVDVQAGRFEEATAFYGRALDMVRRLKITDVDYELAIETGLARVDLGAGRTRRAIVKLEALVARYASPELDAGERASASFALARALIADGQQVVRARRLAEQARAIWAGQSEPYDVDLAAVEAFLDANP